MKKISILAYGEVVGTVGPAIITVNITDDVDTVLFDYTESIGNAGVLYADYYAVMSALQALKGNVDIDTKNSLVECTLSNETVKKQLNSELVITEPGVVPLFIEIHNLRVSSFPNIEFSLT